MRAIDLYSGIGGWALGLKLAGIEVVSSYEWWQPAIDTHNGNLGGDLSATDIRKLKLSDLPSDIDIVVGSPPCTQFSYSNRGGSGDIADGLVDLEKFFEVVAHLKPKFWAMENVPRVAKVLEEAFSDPDHPLFRFASLKPNVEVVDMSDFGCPQARRRCIATNVPFETLHRISERLPVHTLGEVVQMLGSDGAIVDPIWGVQLEESQLTETEQEPALSEEELRLNRDSKIYHPVYNDMSFPDRLDLPSRTVTATCTRVSRESIVVADPRTPSAYRRLSIRERASLQGFPITYQFYGKSFSEKAKMIGNAIPPTFTYVIGSVMLGVQPDQFRQHSSASRLLELPKKRAKVTKVDGVGRTYPDRRRFRAAIPGLRFKSGMRFELANHFDAGGVYWDVKFYSGNSKNILVSELDRECWELISNSDLLSPIAKELENTESVLVSKEPEFDPGTLQEIWTRKREGVGPFSWVDALGDLALLTCEKLEGRLSTENLQETAQSLVALQSSEGQMWNEAKVKKYAVQIVAGFLVGTWANVRFLQANVDQLVN